MYTRNNNHDNYTKYQTVFILTVFILLYIRKIILYVLKSPKMIKEILEFRLKKIFCRLISSKFK